MNILTERPPETVLVAGRETPIRTDFRWGVRFEQAVRGGAGAEELLALWFDEIPEDRAAAVAAALWFYCCGDVPEERPEEPEWEPLYDFGEDAGSIMASFSAAYGVDLSTARMHWWTFRTLLRDLPSESEFKRLTALRGMDLSGLDGEQKCRLKKLQSSVRLRRNAPVSLEERDERWRRRVGAVFRRAGERHGA